ncbi:MAG TPA: class I tRNA ligase family protein [Urbifossiella sp.]|nr:class I tRNA ligase family protein [Urbifossiella sp.]
MTERRKWFQTTAIDYPNSRPHIGTAFEKVGADVQARYRRMEGYEVYFLMGNDENTVKVSKRAAELGLDTQAYCDDMARQFREVWDALEIQYDVFVQTSSDRHKECARKFIQKVYDAGYIYKGSYEGWYCDGCESFKTEKELENGNCPIHKRPVAKRSEPCHFFKLSAFGDRLLKYYEENPDFIQPESRRNEIIGLIKSDGLHDVNITRRGEAWGIQVPFDPEFTIWVWFDALLTYITGIGYGDDRATFDTYWPCDTHFIGKDITRFHCALWPAMLWSAGEKPPTKVFGHGFVYRKDDATGERIKESKTFGNVTEPMDLITKFSSDGFRYYFLRECPFPGDGEFSWGRFIEVFNSELANNLGNLLSRTVTIPTKNYGGTLPNTAGKAPEPVVPGLDLAAFVETVRGHVEGCRFNLALQAIVQDFLTPTNQYLEANAPWKLVKTDKDAAGRVLFNAVQSLRVASILLKPFIPKSAEAIYTSFNFSKPWAEVKYADAAVLAAQPDDLRVTAALVDGKPTPLFPRIV